MGVFTPMTQLAADVGELLTELHVEEQTIIDIVKILNESADSLAAGRPAAVNPVAFGGSSPGASLGHHVQVAHEHVVESMANMVKGLRGFEQNVRQFNSDVIFADEESGDRTKVATDKIATMPVPTLAQATDCAAPNAFTNPEQCTIPGGGA